MRQLLGLCAAAFACLVAAGAAGARPCAGPVTAATAASAVQGARETAIFYYPWFGTPARDGAYLHWQQGGHQPPRLLASSFYPARGPYSSSDDAVVRAHMREIARAGVDTVIVSWWGRGSFEDRQLPRVVAAAAPAGLHVAVHLEPYRGRSVASTEADIAQLRGLGVSDFYVWASVELPDAHWRELNERLDGVRVFANTRYPGKAAAGGFDGLYTYDVLLYDGRLFPRMCRQARKLGLLCAPSVGPGYDARRAAGDARLRPRAGGATYDSMWRGVLRAQADIATITSYNEWHEGTQIEPARAAGGGYESYDGAWGRRGAAAETAYLERTAYWTSRFSGARLPAE